MRFERRVVWGATTGVLLLAAVGCGVASATSHALATVNGHAITDAEWKQSIEAISLMTGQPMPKITASAKKRQIQQLMQWVAVEQWAVSHHLITRSHADTKAHQSITAIEKQAGGTSALKAQLKTYHLTLPQFYRFAVGQEMLQAAYGQVSKGVKPPSAAAVKHYYQSNQRFFENPATDTVRAIVVKSKTQAHSLLTELQAGHANFAALAKQYSLDKTSAKAGGELGPLPLNATNGFPASFTTEMKALKAGQYGIADTPQGYYVMQVQKISPASVRPFSSVKSTIQSQLQLVAANQAFAAFSQKTLKAAKTHLAFK